MSTLENILSIYLEAWNEPDHAARLKLLDACWADDATYTDPYTPAPVEGREGLAIVIDGFHHGPFAGHRLVLTSGVSEHHHLFRYTWVIEHPDGTPVVEGMDFGEQSSDHVLHRIVGFFGSLPSQERTI